MYIALYAYRSDGNGDLVCIIADCEEVNDNLANDLRIVVTGRMNVHEGKDNWFTKESPDPDFPVIWDKSMENLLIPKPNQQTFDQFFENWCKRMQEEGITNDGGEYRDFLEKTWIAAGGKI